MARRKNSRRRSPRSAGCGGAPATDLLRRTAALLREDPAVARVAGLDPAQDARALAALLDLLSAELEHVDPAIRRDVVDCCRGVLTGVRGGGPAR